MHNPRVLLCDLRFEKLVNFVLGYTNFSKWRQMATLSEFITPGVYYPQFITPVFRFFVCLESLGKCGKSL